MEAQQENNNGKEKIEYTGAFAFMTPPWTPYQAAHNIRMDIKSGADLAEVRADYIKQSGLSVKEIDAIIGTLASEWENNGDHEQALKIASVIPEAA